MIEIKKIYTWYNIYVDNVLILKNLSEFDIQDIFKILKETKTKYKFLDKKLI